MLRFVVRRLLLLIPILLGVSLLVFGWIRALPGDPAQALLGERATPERIAQIRHDYGLDEPVWVQYGRYLEQAVESVLDQQGIDLDVLIIGDRSTDGSEVVARRLAEQHDELVVLDLQVQVLDDLNRAEEFLQAAKFDLGHQ